MRFFINRRAIYLGSSVIAAIKKTGRATGQQQAALQRLQVWPVAVREIKASNSSSGSFQIEEHTTRKLRAQHSELVSDWADMREA